MSKLIKSISVKNNSKIFEYRASRVPAIALFCIIIFAPSLFILVVEGGNYINSKLSYQESRIDNPKIHQAPKSLSQQGSFTFSIKFFLGSIPFFLCGLIVFVFLSKYVYFSFIVDLDHNCLIITNKWMFRRIEVKEYSLSNIIEIILEEYEDGAAPNAFLRLKTNDRISIPTGLESSNAIASELQAILQIPMKTLKESENHCNE